MSVSHPVKKTGIPYLHPFSPTTPDASRRFWYVNALVLSSPIIMAGPGAARYRSSAETSSQKQSSDQLPWRNF